MSSNKAIGGYFELEAPSKGDYFRSDEILLQSARACLEYVLRVKNIKKIYVPSYTCDVVYEPIKKLKIEHQFYEIDNQLEITSIPSLEDGEMLLYTNYFGVKNSYSKQLEEKIGAKLILDCSQAYYYENNITTPAFYSPRKFFGVSDGGVLSVDSSYNTQLYDELPTDKSQKRMAHLLARLEDEPEDGYRVYKENDESLSHLPMMKMSLITQRLLSGVDYEHALEQRRENFLFIHKHLGRYNKLNIDESSIGGPLCYPLQVNDEELRDILIRNRIFTPMYWPDVNGEMATELARSIIALPIDQRYTIEDMNLIVSICRERLNGSQYTTLS